VILPWFMGSDQDNNLKLRFYDPKEPDAPSTAASALAQSLEALQRLVHLVAMRREGRTPGKRIRPSADIQARYRLICDLPQRGSYISPVRVEGADLLAREGTHAVVAEIDALLSAVAAHDERALGEAVPDETWRRFYLDALERIVPQPITGVELEIMRGARILVNTIHARPFVERLARAPSRKSVRGSVIGELKRIDFLKQEITIRHRETGRDLSCLYESHVEESLLDHPRDLLLVFGTVTRDAEGRPLSIEDVDHIEPVNLDPEPIEEIIVENLHIVPLEPISADVSFDEEDAVYLASISSVGVSVFAEKRDSLREALHDEIVILWKRYASASDDKLTRAARALKRRVLEAFRGDVDAA
jgi:hypothetical protein